MFRKIGQRFPAFAATGDESPAPAPAPAAHPVAAPWAATTEGPWKFGEGDAAKPWYELIPEEGARQTLAAKGYKNPAELGLAYHNLTKLQRGDPTVIGVPAADAAPEAWSEFYNKTGRPEAPDKYDLKFAEGFKPDEGMMNFARTAFHEAGLNNKQAQAVADKWNAFAMEQSQSAVAQDAQRNTQELDALAAKWGGDLDKNKEAGRRAMQAVGATPELVNRVEQAIGSAAIVEIMALFGRKADEGGFLGGGNQDPDNPDTMSKEQAASRIKQLQGDAAFQQKYTNRADPGHADAVQTVERLYSRV